MRRGVKFLLEAFARLVNWNDPGLMVIAFVCVSPVVIVFFGMLLAGETAGALLVGGMAFLGFVVGVITSLDMGVAR